MIDSNLLFFCLHFWSAEIVGMYHPCWLTYAVFFLGFICIYVYAWCLSYCSIAVMKFRGRGNL